MNIQNPPVVLAACGFSDEGSPDLHLISLSHNGSMHNIDAVRLGDSPSCLTYYNQQIYVGSSNGTYARIRAFAVSQKRFVARGEITLPGEKGLCHLLNTPAGIVGSCYHSGSFFMVSHDLKHIHWLYRTGGRPHWASLHQKLLVMTDLGPDKVFVSSISGRVLNTLTLPDGTGPRQWIPTTNKDGILICETADCLYRGRLTCRNLVLSEKISLPHPGYPGGSCMDPMGRLTVPVRGSDCLVIMDHGRFVSYDLMNSWPRFCLWHHDLLLVCFQKENCVVSYRLDENQLLPLDRYHLPGAAWVLPLPHDFVFME